MAKTFNIGKYAAGLQTRAAAPAIPTERDIEAVTVEILQLKQDAGSAILGIGQRLLEAKAMLPHGEWLPWLTERVEFSERTARNFMRLAREWTNRQALADLGAAKALTLLALPPEERETFMMENHIVSGEEKSVIDMSSRELERVVKERDEARKAAESAQAEARTAEESRVKMSRDLEALRHLQESAQAAERQARDALTKAQAELQALREKPVEVAVETVVDPKAVEKARAEAIAEMQAKVEKAEAELAQVRRKLEEPTQEQSLLPSDAEQAAFNVLFSQAQAQVNKMRELLQKIRARAPETAAELENALLALADMLRGVAFDNWPD